MGGERWKERQGRRWEGEWLNSPSDDGDSRHAVLTRFESGVCAITLHLGLFLEGTGQVCFVNKTTKKNTATFLLHAYTEKPFI